MTYADVYARQEKKVPVWLSVLAIMVVIVFVSFLFVRTEPTSTKASKKTVKKIDVTNLSSAQAAVFWETEQKEPGWVAYGSSKDKLDKIAIDDRDFQAQRDSRLFHYATLKDLTPNSTYYFKLVNEKEIMGNSAGDPFTITTLGKTSQVSNLKPAYGKITDINGAPLDNIVVLFSVKNARILSALSKSSGEWLIPLNYILDKETNTLKILSKDEPVQLNFFSAQGQHSTVNAVITGLSPLPQTVILGKDYTFNEDENVLAAQTETGKPATIDIVFPKENAIIPGTSPLIRGTGIPKKEVTGTITNGKSSVSLKGSVGGDGNWSLPVDQALTQGTHTLTVKTPDTDGKDKELTRTFTIAKSGEQVLGEATGSATPTASPSPTLATTPSPPVSGANISLVAFSSLSLITVGLWLLVFAL